MSLDSSDSLSFVTIETTLGKVVVQLLGDKAPVTVRYFLNLVDQGYYDGGDLYRASQLGVVDGPYLLQGGAALPMLQDASAVQKSRVPLLDEIEATSVTGIHHVRGTISLARDLGRSGKVLPEFFLCLGDFPALDENGRDLHDTQGFPGFGCITEGIEQLDHLAQQETNGQTHSKLLEGQMLTAPIKIVRIYSVIGI